ncbi:MAG: Rrf2 family transcriptional regulator [Acidobacteria bacterium]|nr:Rrf2 family transcriptional regulator [Acidobacteriota bacterium]MDW7985095.1 Rrf2 family transcriptional regulator [Acidobacteriota bacterium]
MRISRSLDYAIRALVYLGMYRTGDLHHIAQSTRVPQPYLAKVMNRLVRKGLVRSTVGRDGGYVLRKPPQAITVREIFEAVEGEFHLFECYFGAEECYFISQNCTQLRFWNQLQQVILKALESTTLADLLPLSSNPMEVLHAGRPATPASNS